MTLISAVGTINGLTADESAIFNRLFSTWTKKVDGHRKRSLYYDQQNLLADLGIAIPDHLHNIGLVLGWPAKAVDTLSRRCKVEEFYLPTVSDDPFGIRKLLRDNHMDMRLPQAFTSSMIHSFVLLSATPGDVAAGDPDVLLSAQSALFSSGIWDTKREQAAAALSIVEINDLGQATEMVMFVPGMTIRMVRSGSRWDIERFPHRLNRIPVEFLAYEPRIERPFGKSRISPAVMGLSDSALRTLYRMEIHSEFFSAPQRYILGADESMFTDADGNPIAPWSALIGRVWGVPAVDDGGPIPQMGQFPSVSPQPHTDQMRALAALFCAETGLPLDAMGIVQDNPSSAEALLAAERRLVEDAYSAMGAYGSRLVRIVQTALMIRNNWTEVPSELEDLSVRWSSPENAPLSAMADAVTKIVAAMPWMGDTSIPGEMLDLDAATLARAEAARRKSGVSSLVQSLRQNQQGNGAGTGN